MIKIYKLTEGQKDILIGKELTNGLFFNPIQDANNTWVLSIEEVNQCNKEEFMWIKELELIDFTPKEDIL